LWQDEQFTILTVPASGGVADLHGRMPVILKQTDVEWWLLDSGSCDGKEIISRALSPEELHCYPVTRAMSNSRYNQPTASKKSLWKKNSSGSFSEK
jgi:putative SOS response-associated peptidase YedK